MSNKMLAIAAKLKQAGQAHHQAFLATNGDDPEWPDWYAEYLLDDLNDHLNADFTRGQLSELLIELDRTYRSEARDEDWTQFYADRLISLYG